MKADVLDNDAGKTQFGVQSVEIGLRVLAVLAQAYQPLMLRDVAKAMGMPAAKVHRYLVSLARGGMVEQDGAGARYGLGPLALTVGLAALHQLDVVQCGSTMVAELRDRTNQTALLAIWGSAGPTIVRWEECRQPVAINARVGSALSLLDSATGLVFAAFLPRHLIEEKLGEEMRERNRDEINELLAEVRDRGLSIVRGNQLASINAVSAPVFDHTTNIVAALTILGPERRFNVNPDSVEVDMLKSAARQVSERLGYPRAAI
jgi:DNA-binding IclR family transcriptional regulator